MIALVPRMPLCHYCVACGIRAAVGAWSTTMAGPSQYHEDAQRQSGRATLAAGSGQSEEEGLASVS